MDIETKYRDMLIKPIISEKTYMMIENNNSWRNINSFMGLQN